MNEALNTLQQFAVEIKEALVDVAPDVLVLVLQVMRIDALQQLVIGVVFLVPVFLTVPHIVRAIKKLVAAKYVSEQDEALWVVVPVTTCSVLFGLIGTLNLLNVWNWVGLFAPELRLAHDLLNKVMGAG